jgi:hypothetical protein
MTTPKSDSDDFLSAPLSPDCPLGSVYPGVDRANAIIRKIKAQKASKQRKSALMRRLAWILAAAVLVSLVIAIVAWNMGPASADIVFLERFPILVLINFALIGIPVLIGSLLERPWRRKQ